MSGIFETSNLDADFGTILCIGYKWMGEPKKFTKVLSVSDTNDYCKHCKRIVNPSDDRGILEVVYSTLCEADGWLTWFGRGFDERFFNTRLIANKMKPLSPTFHIDGWKTAYDKLKLHSNRLKSVQAFLELPDSKTELLPRMWNRAKSGYLDGLGYVVDHCKKDVYVLEEAYDRLKPLVSKNLHRGLFGGKGCPTCGSTRTQSRGYYYTNGRAFPRYQCVACGKWFRDPKAVAHAGTVGL